MRRARMTRAAVRDRPLCAIVLVQGFPDLRFGRRHGGEVEQPAQFARSALGQTAPAAMVSGLIGARIEAGEGDEGIGVAERHALERVEQAAADDGAHAGDLAQARVILLALGIGLDERLDFRVDAREELVQSLSQRFELGGKSLESLSDWVRAARMRLTLARRLSRRSIWRCSAWAGSTGGASRARGRSAGR